MTVFGERTDNALDKGFGTSENIFNKINSNPIVANDIYRFYGQLLVKKDPATNKIVSRDYTKGLGKRLGGLVTKGVNSGLARPINALASHSKIAKPFKFYSRAMDAIGIASLPSMIGSLGWEVTKAIKNTPTKAANLDPRPAEPYEIPHIYDLCTKHPEEFVLDSPDAYKMMADRLAHQDTYILGDSTNTVGFVNGGYRELPSVKDTPYYLRFIYVDPSHQGQGIAQDMVSNVMSKTASSSGYWMQICETNKGMQKVASRLGFELIEMWPQKNVKTGVWYRSW